MTMKKKNTSAIPDFSRKRPVKGAAPVAAADKAHTPSPRQPQKPPAKAKNGGRRGT